MQYAIYYSFKISPYLYEYIIIVPACSNIQQYISSKLQPVNSRLLIEARALQGVELNA